MALLVVPLLTSSGRGYLEARIFEARIDSSSLPTRMLLDFTFPGLSGAQAPAAPVPVPVPAPAAPAPNATAPASSELLAGVGPGQIPGPIPETVNEMLAQLKTRNEEVAELVQRGAFGALWVPAFQARDLAIALEAHLGELPAAGREAAEPAIQLLVRTSWLLDAFGDIGNRQQIVEANSIFASAVTNVVSAFTMKP